MNARTSGRAIRRLLALTVILAGAASIAWAHDDAAIDGGVIHACYQKLNGQLRIVRDRNQCLRSELPIAWNTEGPQGPAGTQGQKGDPGEPGQQGPPGVSGMERVDFSSTNNSEPLKHAFARCPDGKHVVGGGAQVFIGENRVLMGPVAIKKSWPSDAMDGWAATAEEIVPTDLKWFVTAYALCATVAP